jgi:hypothetical protein
MPLGSLSTLGLAGPNGTPLIGVLPAPADPAGGVSCATALPGAIKLPSIRTRTRTEMRDIELSELQVQPLCGGTNVGIKPRSGR